jgi:hypothetical protein
MFNQPLCLPATERMRKRAYRETLISFMMMLSFFSSWLSPISFSSLALCIHYPVTPDDDDDEFSTSIFIFFYFWGFLYFLPRLFVFMNYSTCRSMFRPLRYILVSPLLVYSRPNSYFCCVYLSLSCLLLNSANLFRLLYDCLRAERRTQKKWTKHFYFIIQLDYILDFCSYPSPYKWTSRTSSTFCIRLFFLSFLDFL